MTMKKTNNQLKMFPLFTMVIFQCHISFPGCFPKHLPAFQVETAEWPQRNSPCRWPKSQLPLSLGRVLKSLITKRMERYNKWSRWLEKEGSKMLLCDFSHTKIQGDFMVLKGCSVVVPPLMPWTSVRWMISIHFTQIPRKLQNQNQKALENSEKPLARILKSSKINCCFGGFPTILTTQKPAQQIHTFSLCMPIFKHSNGVMMQAFREKECLF